MKFLAISAISAISAMVAVLCSSCANAQQQEQAFHFDDPSPIECAAFYQQNLMFYIQGITKYRVENDLLGDPDTLINLIADRNRFLELEAKRRGITGMFPLSKLTEDLYAAHIAFRETSERILGDISEAEDRAHRDWMENLVRKCSQLAG